MNFFPILISFLAGFGITWLLTVRKVTREVPVTRRVDTTRDVAPASEAGTANAGAVGAGAASAGAVGAGAAGASVAAQSEDDYAADAGYVDDYDAQDFSYEETARAPRVPESQADAPGATAPSATSEQTDGSGSGVAAMAGAAAVGAAGLGAALVAAVRGGRDDEPTVRQPAVNADEDTPERDTTPGSSGQQEREPNPEFVGPQTPQSEQPAEHPSDVHDEPEGTVAYDSPIAYDDAPMAHEPPVMQDDPDAPRGSDDFDSVLGVPAAGAAGMAGAAGLAAASGMQPDVEQDAHDETAAGQASRDHAPAYEPPVAEAPAEAHQSLDEAPVQPAEPPRPEPEQVPVEDDAPLASVTPIGRATDGDAHAPTADVPEAVAPTAVPQPEASDLPASVECQPGDPAPVGYSVKGDKKAHLYLVPDDPDFARARPDIWFLDERTALDAGYKHYVRRTPLPPQPDNR